MQVSITIYIIIIKIVSFNSKILILVILNIKYITLETFRKKAGGGSPALADPDSRPG